jgi:hypothetical protein
VALPAVVTVIVNVDDGLAAANVVILTTVRGAKADVPMAVLGFSP